MQSPIALLTAVLQDCGELCGVDTRRDVETITSRAQHEGFRFLAGTLADFGKDLQKGLDQGYVTSDMFRSFKRASHARLPAFMQGFLRSVFSPDGEVRADADPYCVYSIRQVCLMVEKVRVDFSESQLLSAMQGFINTESEVRRFDSNFESFVKSPEFSLVDSVFQGLFGEVLRNLNEQIYSGDLVGRHGPGQTAERLMGNHKYSLTSVSARVQEVLPFEENFFHSVSWSYTEKRDVTYLSASEELPVRVIAVPKTVRTPRIIAIEPAYTLFAQKALQEAMYESLERDQLVSRHVTLRNQETNKSLAREGSLDGSLSTIDLSEASDRVSNQLVRTLFSRYRYLSRYLDSTRTRRADVQGFGVQRLSKYASMGSALCFPVETMIFLAISIASQFGESAGNEVRNSTPSRNRTLINRGRFRVSVYGDDIIVPTETAPRAMALLEAFGFKVNSKKSFTNQIVDESGVPLGTFRESCGGDYFRGIDITPVRLREKVPTSLNSATEIESFVSFRNHVYDMGLFRTVKYCDKILLRLMRGIFPYVSETSSVLGRKAPLGNYQVDRIGGRYQSPLVKGYVSVYPVPVREIDPRHALYHFFVNRGDEPLSEDWIQRSGRPTSGRMAVRSLSPF